MFSITNNETRGSELAGCFYIAIEFKLPSVMSVPLQLSQTPIEAGITITYRTLNQPRQESFLLLFFKKEEKKRLLSLLFKQITL
jgi:hypothetical protein